MRAERPSATACLIARSMVLSARDPARRPLVPAADVASLTRILAASGPARWFDFALPHPAAARGLWRLERLVLPGIVLHYLARKRWLEHAVLAQLRAGAEQVVVLGAGFDLLAWRLHAAWPAVRFCELDHPATQRPKSTALAAGPNLAFVSVDLARDLPSAARFDRRLRTCFVAEGLLMYFGAERVATLLRDLADPGARLAFSFMESAAFRGGSASIDAWLRFVGEPFAWNISRADLGPFLQRAGWRLDAVADAAALRAGILAPAGLAHAPLAEGECLALATALP